MAPTESSVPPLVRSQGLTTGFAPYVLNRSRTFSRVDALAHEDPIAALLYLHSQEIAECARRNSEVAMKLIDKHIYLTFIAPRDQAVVEINGNN
jgi:hypothetical protein